MTEYRIVKQTHYDGSIDYRVDERHSIFGFSLFRWHTSTIYWEFCQMDAVFHTLEKAELFTGKTTEIIKEEILNLTRMNIKEIKEASLNAKNYELHGYVTTPIDGFVIGALWMQNQYCLSYCMNCPSYPKTCKGLDYDNCEDVKCYRDNI